MQHKWPFKMNPSLRKAAILVTALDPAAADQLLEQMGEQQAARVRSAVMELPEVDAVEQNAVLTEFFAGSAQGADSGVELELSASPQADAPESDGNSHPGGFEFLQHATGIELARKLAHEHPQLIAVVAAHLSAEKSAQLLERLPQPLQEEVLDRLADLDDADTETLQELRRSLQCLFAGQPQSRCPRGALSNHLQEILKHLRQCEYRKAKTESSSKAIGRQPVEVRHAAIPSRISADRVSKTEQPELAFDQLLSLNAAEFFAVFDEADPRVVMLALAGAPRRLFERYLAQFSTERALEFERHVEQLRPLRLRDVEAAQRELAILAGRRQRSADSAAENFRGFAAAA